MSDGTTRIEAIFARHAEARRQKALPEVRRALAELHARGVEVGVVGSLANGTFIKHSDVDFMIKDFGDMTESAAVRVIFDCVRSVPVDVVLMRRVTPAFLDDLLADYTTEI